MKGNVWLLALLVASAAGFVLGWNAPTQALFRMWFGVAAGFAGLWLAAEAICWQLRQMHQPSAQADPTREDKNR